MTALLPLADRIQALADSTRLRVVALLRLMELSVGELAQVLGQSQPRVSRHLKILADAGVLERRKEGSWVFLTLTDPARVAPMFALVDGWADDATQALFAADAARTETIRAERAAAANRYFASHAEVWDQIRSLHVAESEVERAIDGALGKRTLGRLVDIGTGTGRMIELFGPRASQAIGIDRSSEMLRLARVKLEEAGISSSLRQGDMYALPLPDGSADHVIIHQVLHYAHSPAVAIAEAARLLAPGGTLLVVDFAAHDREELRATDAHIRLGFEDEAMGGWFAAAGLIVDHIQHLKGGELTVTLWRGHKAGLPAAGSGMNRQPLDQLSKHLPLFAEARGDIQVSFEFFPPKTDAMAETLWASIQTLAPLHPRFVSVTYGASGSTRERTHATVERILKETDLTPAAHLTCVGATRDEVDAIARDYWELGVRHIVALRGDPPEPGTKFAPYAGGYAGAAELVAGLKAIAPFEISVAAYPEVHPDSANRQADLDNLKRKVDAGADRAITQFFFSADRFLRFQDAVAAAGMAIEVVPGILPVSNVAQTRRFAQVCGASIPDWLDELFEGLDDLPAARQLIAATVAAELCGQLYAGGVRCFHFYTLNRAELSYAICHLLGVRARA